MFFLSLYSFKKAKGERKLLFVVKENNYPSKRNIVFRNIIIQNFTNFSQNFLEQNCGKCYTKGKDIFILDFINLIFVFSFPFQFFDFSPKEYIYKKGCFQNGSPV